MADNKDNRGMQDRVRIDSNDPSEVEYFHRMHPEFSHQEIKAAIESAGPMRKDVEEYLQREGRRKSSDR